MADRIGECATNYLPDEPQKGKYVYGWDKITSTWIKVNAINGKLETTATLTTSGIEIADVGILDASDNRINPATEETLSTLTTMASGMATEATMASGFDAINNKDFSTESTMASGFDVLNNKDYATETTLASGFDELYERISKLTFDASNKLETTATFSTSGIEIADVGVLDSSDNRIDPATATIQTDGSQKTQIVDSAGHIVSSTVASGSEYALYVYEVAPAIAKYNAVLPTLTENDVTVAQMDINGRLIVSVDSASGADLATETTTSSGFDTLNNSLGTISAIDFSTETTMASGFDVLNNKDVATESSMTSGFDTLNNNLLKTTDLDIDSSKNVGVFLPIAVNDPSAGTTYLDVTTVSASALDANANRTFALFINDSDTVIYLMLGGTAVINTGIRLNANGGSYEIDASNLYKGAVYAIHAGTGNKRLTIQEGATS